MPNILNKNGFSEVWNEAIKTLKIDLLLGISSVKLSEYITDDENEILKRQNIYCDLIDFELLAYEFEDICEKIHSVIEVRQKMKMYLDTENTLYNIRIVELYIDIVTSLEKIYNSFGANLKSVDLKKLLEYYHNVFNGEQFRNICDYVSKISNNIRNIKSFTVGINLNSRLEPEEIGIVSMNDEYFVSSNFFTKHFSKNSSDTLYVTPLIKSAESNGILEKSLYTALNTSLVKAIEKAQYTVINAMAEQCREIIDCREDLLFICRSCRFIREVKEKGGYLTFASIDNSNIQITDAYDPFLLNKLPFSKIIKNDIIFNRDDAFVYILTGANSGGKSVFLRTVGIQQILFQLGMPVLARKARTYPFSSLFTHISTDQNVADESRFVSECKKMKDILDKASKESLILMDETFSGTGSVEGAAVAHQVLKTICHKRIHCVFSTHIHEIVTFIGDLNKRNKMVVPMSVEMKDGERTYKIIYDSADDMSHAYDIAKKYGLEFTETE